MKKHGITAHCLVRNEERWIWYAIKAVIQYLDRLFVFDTGSTDHTVDIIKTIHSPKIVFEQMGIASPTRYTKLRQEMLDRTKTPWFMLLDGDEIWPRVAMKALVTAVKNAPKEKEAVIVPQWVCQGDVFHYSQEVENLKDPNGSDFRGFRLPRAWRKTSGLHSIGTYGIESFADKNGINVSYWDAKRLIYLQHKFFHMSFLPRSENITKDREVMMRAPKTRFSRGNPFPSDFKYPEVFYEKTPDIVTSPWRRLTFQDQVKGLYYRSQNLIHRMMN